MEDYSYPLSSSEKTAVVIEFGSRFVRIGYTGEATPRFAIRTRLRTLAGKHLTLVPNDKPSIEASSAEWSEALEDLLREIFYIYLQTNPSERRVVLCTNFVHPEKFSHALGLLLFKRFNVPSIACYPSMVLPLFPLECTTALVIDAGYVETRVIPVVDGYPQTHALCTVPLGALSLHSRIGELLSPLALAPDTLEDIAIRLCFIRPRSAALSRDTQLSPVRYVSKSGGAAIEVSSAVRGNAADVLFEGDSEGLSLATVVLDSLRKCQRDCRAILARNMLMIGGLAMLPGFALRLVEEIEALLEGSETPHQRVERYDDLRGLRGQFGACRDWGVHAPHIAGWVGGAVLGAVEGASGALAAMAGGLLATSYAVAKEQFMEQCRPLPDWSRLGPK